MSDLPEHIKRKIWKRDGYRCQACGIKVGQDRGLRPHTHHTIPKWLGGSDEEKNLITLCQPCHSGTLSHTFMLEKTPAEDFPQYIKYLLWEVSLNLVAYADYLDPRNFPSADQVVDYIKKAQKALEGALTLAEICQQTGIGGGTLKFEPDLPRETQQLEDIVKGMRIAWTSHYTQRGLDHIIGERIETLMGRMGMRCPSCGQGRLEYRIDDQWQGFRCVECSWRSPGGGLNASKDQQAKSPLALGRGHVGLSEPRIGAPLRVKGNPT